jgi:hypothetical protein
MIGYPVSGHPLDGMKDFIQSKSKNIGPIYEWLEKKDTIELVEEVEKTEKVEKTESVELPEFGSVILTKDV